MNRRIRRSDRDDVPSVDDILALYKQQDNDHSPTPTTTSSLTKALTAPSPPTMVTPSEESGGHSRWKLPAPLGVRRSNSYAGSMNAKSEVQPPAPHPNKPCVAPPTTSPNHTHQPHTPTSADQRPHPPCSRSPEPLLRIPGHCTFKSSRLKFGGVSQQWLESCKPSLDNMGVSDSVKKSGRDVRQADSNAEPSWEEEREGVENQHIPRKEREGERNKDIPKIAREREGEDHIRVKDIPKKEREREGKDHIPMRDIPKKEKERGRDEYSIHVMKRDGVKKRESLPAEKDGMESEEEWEGDDKPIPPPPTTKRGKATSCGGGAVSENFVKLNMKLKRFCRRPGRALSGSAYKRAEWKKRQKGEGGGKGGRGKFVCYKCGKSGHWARNCTDKGGATSLGSFAGQKVGFSESMVLDCEEDLNQDALRELAKESPFPTISEAAAMVDVGGGRSKVAATPPVDETVSDHLMDVDWEDFGEISPLPQDAKPSASHTPSLPDCAPPSPSHTPSSPNHTPSLLSHTPSSPSHTPSPMEPIFTTKDGQVPPTPPSVLASLKKLGFSDFRPGQEGAIMRVLCGISTLLITGTGSGKSLCYQLPAYMYRQTRPPCITLVVSPLVSLMDDQVRQFPRGLKGACLHTNQTRPQREKVLREVSEGKVDVLLLSPEAVVGGALWRRGGCGHSLHDLPPVAFACIDEVHCVSEWSHNFRPSYLQLYKVLSERLGVRCVLGLTATATHTTSLSVARHLGVASQDIIRGPTLPDNLHITASCDLDRDQALLDLLNSEPFANLHSIIIYCTRQQTTATLAQMLRTNFQSWNQSRDATGQEEEDESGSESTNISDSSNNKRRRKSASSARKGRAGKPVFAECYHAGLSAAQRRSVQNKFMSGTVRIVVATVAFGMGLNKANVRAIVHYNMPKSFESYVQEIGRAGRDGDPAYCHVFIDKEGSDLYELYRHIHSNSVDHYTIKKLVERALPITQPDPSISKSKHPGNSGGHEVAIPIEQSVQELDVKEECLSTLLCYMELQGWLELRSSVYDTCTLKCYGGARQLRALARKVPAVAAATARLREKGADLENSKEITFSITETAAQMGWDSNIVRSELIGLQKNDRGTCPSATPSPRGTVLVELEQLAFHVVSHSEITRNVRDSVIQSLVDRVAEQVRSEVEKVRILHAVLQSVATDTVGGKVTGVKSAGYLKDCIGRYFDTGGLSASDLAKEGVPLLSCASELSAEEQNLIGLDVAALVSRFSDQSFTGRAIARIFQGIASPRFPALVWGEQRGFWRKYLRVDFNALCQLATRKLLEYR